MRRWLYSGAYFLAGLLATWASLWIGSRIDYRIPVTRTYFQAPECPEVGVCAQSWWVAALLYVHFFWPAVACAILGWRESRRGAVAPKRLFSLVILAAAALIYYVLSYLTLRR